MTTQPTVTANKGRCADDIALEGVHCRARAVIWLL